MRIRRGEVYYIDSGYMTTGSEQRAGRPAIVVSNDMNNEFSSTIQVVYLTTQPKTDLPTHVLISSIKRESIALCEQITAVAVERIGDYCGEVTDSEMAKIESAMLASLGIQDLPEPKEETPPRLKIDPQMQTSRCGVQPLKPNAQCCKVCMIRCSEGL